jgi:hypothetical protein
LWLRRVIHQHRRLPALDQNARDQTRSGPIQSPMWSMRPSLLILHCTLSNRADDSHRADWKTVQTACPMGDR